ncbi:MAG TPA: hypothetical protein VKD90_14440 [Gemmataceae bacterium]|nr:hypothetical protein [Gemmataceae bacterium]
MTWKLATLSVVLAVAAPLAVAPARGQSKDDLAARVQQLEKKVAELEATIKHLQGLPRDPARTDTAGKVVGSWTISDEDRKAEGLFTDLRLNADGTGKAVINHPDGKWNNVKYDVVGKQLNLREERGGMAYALSVRIQSLSDTEMVLEYRVGDKSRIAKYTREK